MFAGPMRLHGSDRSHQSTWLAIICNRDNERPTARAANSSCPKPRPSAVCNWRNWSRFQLHRSGPFPAHLSSAQADAPRHRCRRSIWRRQSIGSDLLGRPTDTGRHRSHLAWHDKSSFRTATRLSHLRPFPRLSLICGPCSVSLALPRAPKQIDKQAASEPDVDQDELSHSEGMNKKLFLVNVLAGRADHATGR